MAKKKKSESEGESNITKGKNARLDNAEFTENKSKKTTKGKRPAAKQETFAEIWQRDTEACAKSLASYQAYQAAMKKREIQIFKERCESLGYSFVPLEEKLVDFYLRSKNSGQEIENSPIEEVDVYANHPKCLVDNGLHTPGKVGYFFTRSRPNEIQSSSDNVQGHWIFTKKGDVLSQGKKVGVKQVFEFWEGDHCIGYKIIEYQLDPAPVDPKPWFVCKLLDDESCLAVSNQA